MLICWLRWYVKEIFLVLQTLEESSRLSFNFQYQVYNTTITILQLNWAQKLET